MRRFPADFASLLSREGRRVLDGGHELAGALGRDGRRFLARNDLLDERKSRACLALLERVFADTLTLMEKPIPPQAIWGMEENYAELLPKASRVLTATFENGRASSTVRAHQSGLLTLLRSDSFRRFAEVLNGRPLRKAFGVQLLCYGAGDYAGPHNDHHPEDAEAADGYVDVHLTFSNAAVRRQLLVYERRGHFTEVAEVDTVGGVTAYRLPFWHYTTPLEARPGQQQKARRWVLLGTFIDRKPRVAGRRRAVG